MYFIEPLSSNGRVCSASLTAHFQRSGFMSKLGKIACVPKYQAKKWYKGNMYLIFCAFLISALDGGEEWKRTMYPLYVAKLRN
jgi:hypothetical protein